MRARQITISPLLAGCRPPNLGRPPRADRKRLVKPLRPARDEPPRDHALAELRVEGDPTCLLERRGDVGGAPTTCLEPVLLARTEEEDDTPRALPGSPAHALDEANRAPDLVVEDADVNRADVEAWVGINSE